MRLIQREVTIVFRGGPSALKGKVIEEYDDVLVVDGGPVGVSSAPAVNIVPWHGIAYVRMNNATPVDQ